MVMNVLSSLLNLADDLLVFAKVATKSVTTARNVLEFIYQIWGLQVNNCRTDMFSSGVGQVELYAMGFRLGTSEVISWCAIYSKKLKGQRLQSFGG
ncbi:hypothetical protein PVK06_005976 [Gossypium arboreum]|uniref:Reverse transcriptase domain-containing protein n=1 Tax=Gossypium arboreum TaxID=29729 RepID=A0ABR0QW23_GOSAR|nr:hypothetical protein PVK06_005976 [Gossypium arboreum]